MDPVPKIVHLRFAAGQDYPVLLLATFDNGCGAWVVWNAEEWAQITRGVRLGVTSAQSWWEWFMVKLEMCELDMERYYRRDILESVGVG